MLSKRPDMVRLGMSNRGHQQPTETTAATAWMPRHNDKAKQKQQQRQRQKQKHQQGHIFKNPPNN